MYDHASTNEQFSAGGDSRPAFPLPQSPVHIYDNISVKGDCVPRVCDARVTHSKNPGKNCANGGTHSFDSVAFGGSPRAIRTANHVCGNVSTGEYDSVTLFTSPRAICTANPGHVYGNVHTGYASLAGARYANVNAEVRPVSNESSEHNYRTILH